ncbi:MAG TPA: glycoside hydrolase family 38 C-terminal domain-containing protein [bacterium]|nr:glycoside hydrolase family 38 C-terminal domain-containing protein [bacterium]HQL60876.1 glycoside hydrolase family 38 C-terminal domain-containing protein [bacterium]
MTEAATSDTITYHAIGHGHIDPVWLWRWQEGYEEIRATFRSALDRMKETPDLCFIAGSAAFYKWILEIDPPMFMEIQDRVREGRWNIVGGWIVEPDCNIPGGESLVRHGLYGQRFFRTHFGLTVTEAFNPDAFGHTGTLPQILKKSGFSTYTYMRPAPDTEMKYAYLHFQWEARDGSRVLAGCIPICYDVLPEGLEKRFHELQPGPYRHPDQRHEMFFFGIGNHGGGPTKKCIRIIQDLQSDRNNPPICFSTLSRYYQCLTETLCTESLPVVRTDLQHHARGCYTSHSEVKRLNRQCEHALMQAERWSAVGTVLQNLPDRRESIREAWETVLCNQFHDILAGTSIEAAYQDVRNAYGSVLFTTDKIRNRVIQEIAKRIDTTGEGRNMVVFNPLPWRITSPVRVPSSIKHFLGRFLRIVDDSGKEIPSQDIVGQQVGNRDLLFLADVPGLGYRTYRGIPLPGTARKQESKRMLHIKPGLLENDYWRIRVDGQSGEVVSLYDKKNKVETLERGLSLCVMADQSDTWSHGIDGWRVEDGRFQLKSIRILDSGPCMATLRITYEYNRSTAEVHLSLYRDIPDIHATLHLNWQECYRFLKIAFKTRIVGGKATFDVPYGCIERTKTGNEEPGQSWIDLTGNGMTINDESVPYGFSVINDCKFGYDVLDKTLRISLVRSPAYAHHDPARVDTSEPIRYMDLGEQTIRFVLVPHSGPWQGAHIPRKAWGLNEPLWLHQESAHSGDLPLSASFTECDSEHFVPTVLKIAEDDDTVVLRGYESEGKEGTVVVRFPYWNREISFPVSPHEIKTIRVTPKGGWEIVEELNLLEDKVEG